MIKKYDLCTKQKVMRTHIIKFLDYWTPLIRLSTVENKDFIQQQIQEIMSIDWDIQLPIVRCIKVHFSNCFVVKKIYIPFQHSHYFHFIKEIPIKLALSVEDNVVFAHTLQSKI